MAFFPDSRISVKPVVFYAKGVAHDPKWSRRWRVMHTAVREKYRLMLKNRDTFALDDQLLVLDGDFTFQEYKNLTHRFGSPILSAAPDCANGLVCSQGRETILAEIMQHPSLAQYNRYTLPHCLSILVIASKPEWEWGGGRNLNGGVNQGGGFLFLPSWHFDENKLLSSLLHELGHTFALIHSWERVSHTNHPRPPRNVYKCFYHQWHSPAIMSYNKSNHTNSVDVAAIPGCLLGDDIDTLSRNRLVFPDLFFDKNNDFDCLPLGTNCQDVKHDGISRQYPPESMGKLDTFWCYTDYGDIEDTEVENLHDNPDRYIPGNSPDEPWAQIAKYVWHSGKLNEEGWVSLEVTFPLPVTLDQIKAYSQHSGQHHAAKMVQVEAQKPTGKFDFVTRVAADKPDTDVTFSATTARIWKLSFKGGNSNHVVIRGLRFFHGKAELFPPEGPLARTTFGETHGSKVSNLVAIQRRIHSASLPEDGFDPATMWHSGQTNEEGWAAVEIVFPKAVSLDCVIVYSGHSGQFHPAQEIQIEIMKANGQYEFVSRDKITGSVVSVSFPAREAQVWKLAFRGKVGGFIVLRGLRFRLGTRELYPPAKLT